MIALASRQWGRRDRVELLRECAEWFVEHPDHLLTSATADDLVAAPHVTRAIADLATRVHPGETEDPVLANYGVLRVAARFQGVDVDRQNKLSDGRLALARMIGGDDQSHEAHLALIELANGICGPGAPDCGRCPLEPWCEEAARRPVQGVFGGPAGA
jgi:DNA (cytosine-5)-methyltransferase 1